MQIIAEYKGYFYHLTEVNQLLKHENVAGRVAFGIENIADVIDGTIRTSINERLYLFLLLNPIVRPQSNNNGFNAILQGGFVLLKGGVSIRESTDEDIKDAYNHVGDLVLDFLTRMVDDSRAGHSFWNHGFDTIEAGDLDIEELAYSTQQDSSFVGYKVVFSLLLKMLDCSDFNNRLTPAKWTDK
jgi:hypothetical protein